MIRFKDFKTTLQYNDKLNTKFWRNEKLLGSVRSALMKIAKEWAEFANIPESSIKDIILVGGNANFNYTKYSDLDLHLLVDKSKIANCPDLLDDYLRDKKQLWSLTHDIKIYGHDVELYAQDISDPTPRNQGVFSLTKNTWVTKPVKETVNLNDPLIKQKVASFIERIDSLIDTRSDDVEPLRKIKEKLREMRSSSIQRGGEFALENLVFKELRNLGYIDKINKHITKAKDQSLSLE